jgi:hypothetical protein
MATIDPELEKALRFEPTAMHEVILTATEDLDDMLSHAKGSIEVLHRYRLTGSAAVRGPASELLALARLDSVAKIEPVRSVGSW